MADKRTAMKDIRNPGVIVRINADNGVRQDRQMAEANRAFARLTRS